MVVLHRSDILAKCGLGKPAASRIAPHILSGASPARPLHSAQSKVPRLQSRRRWLLRSRFCRKLRRGQDPLHGRSKDRQRYVRRYDTGTVTGTPTLWPRRAGFLQLVTRQTAADGAPLFWAAVPHTHSAHSSSACASTVFTASSCKSGGSPCLFRMRFTITVILARALSRRVQLMVTLFFTWMLISVVPPGN